MNLRVLVAETEASTRRELLRALEDCDVFEADCGAVALEALRSDEFSLVVTSMDLGDTDGLTVLAEIASRGRESVVVVTVDDPNDPTAKSALRSGAHDLLVRPLDEILTKAALDRALQRIRLEHENEALLSSLKRNVEALGRQNSRLEHLATHDELTGLYNYRFFREALEMELARCRRHGRVASVVFADVDHFKEYNDTQGHLAGDVLLTKLAALLLGRARRSTLVARYGGEEFVLLVPEADRCAAREYAEDIRTRVEQFEFGGRRITLSIGIASFPECGTDANALLKCADDALYRAKAAGRNTVCG